jgi:hypothetical protein
LGSLITSKILTEKRKGTILLLKKQRAERDKNLSWEEAEEASINCKKKKQTHY